MAKTFYSDYSAHCIRLYARHGLKGLSRVSDIKDWTAAKDAFERLPDSDREALLFIYGEKGNVGGKVDEAALKWCISPGELWKKMYALEYKVAENRGLR